MRMRVSRIGAQPTLQPRSQVAQRKRARWIRCQVSFAERVELLIAHDCAQTNEVLIQTRQNAEPIGAAVDFEPLDRT